MNQLGENSEDLPPAPNYLRVPWLITLSGLIRNKSEMFLD